MKILQINAVFGYKSTGTIVKDIHDLLIEEGHESYVAYQEANNLSENGMLVGNLIDWKYHALYTRIAGRQAYASKIATKRLILKIKQIQPDIVHLHNLHGNFINLNDLLGFLGKYNIKTVVTLHDCWYFTGKCFHFIDVQCEKWKTGCGACPKNKMDIPSIFFDRTSSVLLDKINHFNAIENLTVVGCSNWISNMAKQSPAFRFAKVINIYNGINTKNFSPLIGSIKSKYGLEDKFVILGMANKWLIDENCDVIEYICSQLKNDEVLMLAGCTTKQMKEISKYNKVIGIKYTDDATLMAKLFVSADVFVNLTFVDTLPTVNMESICCGTPVITYDSSGSAELVVQGITGYIIKPKDAIGLIEAIAKVKNGNISRENCSSYGATHFDKSSNYKEYIDLYLSL